MHYMRTSNSSDTTHESLINKMRASTQQLRQPVFTEAELGMSDVDTRIEAATSMVEELTNLLEGLRYEAGSYLEMAGGSKEIQKKLYGLMSAKYLQKLSVLTGLEDVPFLIEAQNGDVISDENDE